MKKIVRFTASWCGPCKMLAKTLEEVDSKLPIEVVDIDIHPEIAAEFATLLIEPLNVPPVKNPINVEPFAEAVSLIPEPPAAAPS